MGGPKAKAFVYDPNTHRWVKGNVSHLKAFGGEQSMGFYFGERGSFIVEGPSGAGGHSVTASGFDGVAFNPTTKDLVIYDNKAYKKVGSVASASAIESNLEKNLEGLIERVSKTAAGQEMPHSAEILKQLRRALRAARTGQGWPKGVRLAISNASGNSLQVSSKLAGAGIKWINHNDLRGIQRARHSNPRMKSILKEFDKRAGHWEKEAAEKIAKDEARIIERRVAKAVAEHGALFARKRLPRLIARLLLNKSARAAAHGAATFIPIAGWAFDAQDAYHGVEDIFRGHTARGLAGMGLAIGSVAADFLNIGDAVSGVGGTALAIAAHGALMAGQIGIGLQRDKEKMDELEKEIGDTGQLPPDQRLRDFYDMDEEDILELKKDFAKPDSAPEEPMQLPPLPGANDDPNPPPVYFRPVPPPPEPPTLPYTPQPFPHPTPGSRPSPQMPPGFPCV